MARKRKYIDRKLMKTLAMCQLTNEEIANCLRISADTLMRRYAEPIKAWKRLGVASVRRELYITAMGQANIPGKMTAAIFYLKNFGGMADNKESSEPVRPLGVNGLPTAVEFDRADRLNKPN